MPHHESTGKYPNGQLHPTERDMYFRIGSYNGKVILDFGLQAGWLELDPEEAENVAQSLLESAQIAHNQRK